MTQLEEIEKVLADYEKKYGMSSVEFLKIYESGQTDDSMDSVEWASLTKMAGHLRQAQAKEELNKLKTDLVAAEKDLSKFEKQYNISTEDFYSQWQAGKTDDHMDFVEWASLAQMADDIRKQIEILDKQIFPKALEYVLEKNKELYKRLA